MPTKNQLAILNCRVHRVYKKRRKVLIKSPQKKGNCLAVFTSSPKKPNSAKRKIAKVFIPSQYKKIDCHIPGINHNLQKFSTVLIHGGYIRDLPSVNYRVLRGKFDLDYVSRLTSRSKYGCPKLKYTKDD
jgi:small subunit ribosomal protein S12